MLSGCQLFLEQPDNDIGMEEIEQPFYGLPEMPRNNSAVDYDQSLMVEKFLLARPTNFDPEKTYGLIVFVSPVDEPALPLLWSPVLVERDLLMICPKDAGNDQDPARRAGLAIAAAYAMSEEYKIDPDRVYAAGLSGGARIASSIAFYHPELFSGTIQSVGSDFIRPVPQVRAETQEMGEGALYGEMRGSDEVDVGAVKERVRFVIITGNNDFRYGNLQDIYQGGFQSDGYQAKFLDVPGMAHRICQPEALAEALDFIEGK